jgi:hypothetical protein
MYPCDFQAEQQLSIEHSAPDLLDFLSGVEVPEFGHLPKQEPPTNSPSPIPVAPSSYLSLLLKAVQSVALPGVMIRLRISPEWELQRA